MSPRARHYDNAAMVMEGMPAFGRAPADAIFRTLPANDDGLEGRLNLLVTRRRRHNRRDIRA